MKLHLLNHLIGLEGWDHEGRKQHLHIGHIMGTEMEQKVLLAIIFSFGELNNVSKLYGCCTEEQPFCPPWNPMTWAKAQADPRCTKKAANREG